MSRSAEIRSGLPHPVVDADGHWIETAPVIKSFFLDYVRDQGGPALMARFEAAGGIDYDETVLRPWSRLGENERRAHWTPRPPWWTLPAANTLDRATAHLPRLLAARLDEFGIDFAVLYPSRLLTTPAIKDAELRQIACRALNAYHAEIFAPFADRLTPVALVPTHTPEEAVAELEHAVRALGLKAAMINGLVHRPIGATGETRRELATAKPADLPAAKLALLPNWGSGSGERIDALGLDSEHDYDRFWAACVRLGVAPASHTPGMGWGSRRSISSYVYNHVGSFGASMEAFCKALFLGGVTRRFPTLCFGLLEGGVSWAAQLYADLVGHWEKRNRDAIRRLDPSSIDAPRLAELFARYGDGRFAIEPDRIRDAVTRLEPEPPALDEFAACGVEKVDDFRERFVDRFYFGCEADDALVATAFDRRLLPLGSKLHAMFSSDIGHWDVPDMSEVLEEAWELVERGLLGEDDFRDFVFANPVRFYTSANPHFFRGTRVEREAAALIAEPR